MQTLAKSISISAQLNFAKWPTLGIWIWPNAAGFESRLTYQSEVDFFIDWISKRFEWLDSAINAL